MRTMISNDIAKRVSPLRANMRFGVPLFKKLGNFLFTALSPVSNNTNFNLSFHFQNISSEISLKITLSVPYYNERRQS